MHTGSEERESKTQQAGAKQHERRTTIMSFTAGQESRHPTSYAELDGVEVKISDKLRRSDSSYLLQAEMKCMTLKDLSRLDTYEYDFQVEHFVLQNFNTDDLKNNSPH